MGEPLSVAGSAVGIISLGIQVCQGLVQYADAIREQQRDVDDGMDEVRSLLAVFKSLKQTIARIEIDSPENAKSLLEHLRQAEAKLQSLEETLTEVGIPVNATPSSIKGKMKKTYRVAIYPMKKGKLEGARQNVQSILGILATALQTVDLRLLDIIEPDDEHLIKAMLVLYPALDCIFPLLQSRISSLDVSPIAGAILSRSMSDLEYQLEFAPTSVHERTYGYTTLQLASTWPQGFMRLIQTDARALLHEPMPSTGNLLAPHPMHGFNPCLYPSILETLLDAGHTLFPDNQYFTLRQLLKECSATTARIIAKYLSQRLRQLSELAAKFGITSNDDSSMPDFVTAAHWCLSLEELGEFIDPSIRVPISDDMVTTIYHFERMPLNFFPIFYAHGFIHVNACDRWGLPPLFVRYGLFWYREEYFLSQPVPNDSLELFHDLSWLRKHGLLNQKPHDPLGLGLNIDATGAHWVAAEMGSNFYLDLGDQQEADHYLSLASDLLWQLARDSYGDLDKCVCWCNSDGDGCSPIKLLYKSVAHPIRYFYEIVVSMRGEFQAASITRLLFDFDIFEVPTTTPTPGVKQQRERDETTNARPSTRALELVRFLTFESLEMTHTCCMLENLPKGNWYDTKVILNCTPGTVSDIRQSEEERRNAALLETLMNEFSNVMQQDYHAKSLLDFIFGYWKTRVEGLYAVREDEVQKMQQYVNNVRTGIWPMPLRRLLWPRQGGYWEDADSASVYEETDSGEDENDDEHQEREDSD
ncbi:hypothetical protein CEP54_009348 [Fusarium duplospermum]|uniref:Fungal N-terminal domain-containing protein n=1 Tax=Fusarium duplospermum TaxID=1325734 RepID=A0A428PQX7_9HYPO|nr:hypothetical protein CEP54_009348 [Fusarium duplospermum]